MPSSCDWGTPSDARSRNMAAVKRTNTLPEVRLRRAVHSAGHRFRKDFPIRIDGRLIRPDIAFTKLKIAVFVDGCFWHRCPVHGQTPATNLTQWQKKLDANVDRDRAQDKLLGKAGWLVLRIWEHESIVAGVTRVEAAIMDRRRSI